jgi:hypothetical protein
MSKYKLLLLQCSPSRLTPARLYKEWVYHLIAKIPRPVYFFDNFVEHRLSLWLKCNASSNGEKIEFFFFFFFIQVKWICIYWNPDSPFNPSNTILDHVFSSSLVPFWPAIPEVKSHVQERWWMKWQDRSTRLSFHEQHCWSRVRRPGGSDQRQGNVQTCFHKAVAFLRLNERKGIKNKQKSITSSPTRTACYGTNF